MPQRSPTNILPPSPRLWGWRMVMYSNFLVSTAGSPLAPFETQEPRPMADMSHGQQSLIESLLALT